MKGDRIYIVLINGTYDEGAMVFENYQDAFKYANDKAEEFIMEVDCDEQYITHRVLEEEKYTEGKELISKTPYRVQVTCDNSEEDYCYIAIVKETIH